MSFEGLERAVGGKSLTTASFIVFLAGRERETSRMEADTDDTLEAE